MIVAAIKDRLGNQMFQYACALGLAAKQNTTVKMDKRYYEHNAPEGYFYGLDAFNIKQDFITDKEIKEYTGLSNKLFHKGIRKVFKDYQVANANHIYDERFFHFDDQLEKQGDKVYIRGYWQSYKYFDHIAPQIKEVFKPKNKIDIENDLFAQQIINSNAVMISVRRGDHFWHPVTKEKYGRCNQDYYLEGLKIITEKNKDVKLFIFSDDIKWCEENLKFDHPTVFVKSDDKTLGPPYFLQLMSLCKHFIIPVSTFPWWGAWLSEYQDKIVIVPKIWFTDQSIITNDLFPDNWIRLHNE